MRLVDKDNLKVIYGDKVVKIIDIKNLMVISNFKINKVPFKIKEDNFVLSWNQFKGFKIKRI